MIIWQGEEAEARHLPMEEEEEERYHHHHHHHHLLGAEDATPFDYGSLCLTLLGECWHHMYDRTTLYNLHIDGMLALHIYRTMDRLLF